VLCDFHAGKVAHLHRLALVTRSVPGLHEEAIGAPKFPQVLHCPFALFFDPGRIAASDHYEASNVAPSKGTLKTPTMKHISWLNGKAFGLVVYASQ
jgi:hypothetical protein